MLQVLLVHSLGWPLWIAVPLAFGIASCIVYLTSLGVGCWWHYIFEGDASRDDWYEIWGIPLAFVMNGAYAVGDFFSDRYEDIRYTLTNLRVARQKIRFLRQMGIYQKPEWLQDPYRAAMGVMEHAAMEFHNVSRERVYYQQNSEYLWGEQETVEQRVEQARKAFWAKHAVMATAYPDYVRPSYTEYLPQGYRCMWDGLIDVAERPKPIVAVYR